MSRITEAIVLAGGFGTRLRHVLGDVPKPMAPVAGKPFLTYLLDKLQQAGIEHVVLSTGYRHEVVADYFGEAYRGLRLSYAHETTPLFTGGALMLALRQTYTDNVLALNGDTLFDINFTQMATTHLANNAKLTVALRRVPSLERYGAVQLSATNTLTGFAEKGAQQGEGLINGGIYLINKQWLSSLNMPEKFSFEKEVLEPLRSETPFFGYQSDGYFIDIGVPDDYARAQHEFPSLFPQPRFLFLDRDGVINRHLWGDYVKTPTEFEFLPGAQEALAKLSQHFERIFVVTNQQGVGKGLFSEADLAKVHQHMCTQIAAAGGRIDHVYCCTDLEAAHSHNRKPQIGMAVQAQHDFPEVDWTKSVMVGDALSDVEFGYRAGMQVVFVTDDQPIPADVQNYTDLIYNNLSQYSARF